MTDLTGKKIANTYKDLLQINSSATNNGIDGTLRRVQDGSGNNSSLKLSQTSAAFTGNVSIAGSLVVQGAFQPTNLQTTNIIATSITTQGLNATNLIFQDVSVSSLRTGDLFANTVSAGTVSATNIAGTNITLAGEPVATSAGLATVSSTMATSIANVSAALETRIAGVSSTFASTSATLESHINTVSATLSSTNVALQTSIANVSSTMATSIANVSAALETRIAGVSVLVETKASAGTSATLETRIAGVSSTFATTSATLETRIATVSNTLATSIGNQMPLAGGTFTGQVTFNNNGFTVNSNASAVFNGPIRMNSSIQLGNSSGDTITGAGRWGTDIIPNSTTGRVLGTDSLRWDEAYINRFSGGIDGTNTSVTNLIYPSPYGKAPATVDYVTSAVAAKASVGTSATLETRIAAVSSTMATSIANIGTSFASAGTSATLETRIAAVSSTMATSIGNQMPKSGGTFTGNVAFDSAISVVGQVHTANGVKVSSSYPYVNFSETDTTDLNSSLINNGGKFQLGTANNNFGSFTSRFEIDHSTGNANFTANVTATAFYGDGSNLTGIAAASVGTSATLETRIAGVSSTFATTSATLATSIATAAAAAVAFAIALG